MPETQAQVFIIWRPPPRRVLFEGKRNTVSTSHAIFEITLTAPHSIKIRVSNECGHFPPREATRVNIL